jgi:CRISPR-associated endonuclease/helicase Cas3
MRPDRLLELYRTAFGAPRLTPFPYQEKLAPVPLCNRALVLPTGAGKTAAAVLSWLYQLEANRESTPGRLVYCLPMRALVEQTRQSIEKWLKALGLDKEIALCTLMGGDVEDGWELAPDRPAIVVATQDMVLSRALNRGYAMNRYRWPVDFALLNNDCLWVMDEVQLFGSGLATSTQLQAFREVWSTMGPTATWWMSATFDPAWLATVDFAASVPGLPVTRLEAEDLDETIAPDLVARYRAAKPVSRLSALTADAVINAHASGSLTLVVVNTVARAQDLYSKLETGGSKRGKRKTKGDGSPETLLIHSRFRPPDRVEAHELLIAADALLRGESGETLDPDIRSRIQENGLICVATQVVEAGLDISAKTLITEIAPWASMVQRAGRCNRLGRQDGARIYWVDLTKKDDIAPYDAADLKEARERLAQLPESNASPENIDALGPPLAHPPAHVIRRHDLLGLFSTEPDLAGGFTDVSRFVRDLDPETDVYVFWREFQEPPSSLPRLGRDELCSVPIGGLRHLIEKAVAWEWNGELRRWERRRGRDARPGMTLLLHCATGGYDKFIGWTGDQQHKPEALATGEDNEPDSLPADTASESTWVPLAVHLQHAVAKIPRIPGMSAAEASAVGQALRWHDVGKTHRKWQEAILKAGLQAPEECLWAKFPRVPKGRFTPGLRHEAASALYAWHKWTAGAPEWTALAVYLIAAHHGKVRTVLRSRVKDKPGGSDVFGVEAGDFLAIPGLIDPPFELDLSPRMFGASGEWVEDGFRFAGPGWVEVVAELLDPSANAGVLDMREPKALGPFRLAMLEACVTIADVQASREEEGRK